MLFADLDTPAVVIDLDVVEANLSRMQRVADASSVKLRPHTKTHKSRYFAERQLALGATGLTVAKLGEAEVMASVCDDILVAYPIIGEQKLQRLHSLLGQVRRVRVTTDSIEVARGYSSLGETIGRPIEVYLEVDSGLGRLGLPPDDQSVHLAKQVAALPGVRLVGVMTHGGFSYGDRTVDALHASAVREGQPLVELANQLRAMDIPIEDVSVGSSPTAPYVADVPGATEMRPGTYIFNDLKLVATGDVSLEQCAAHVLVTVVSRPAPDRAVVDGGSKTFTSDKGVQPGHGRALGMSGLWLEQLSEEHGWLRIDDPATSLAVGDRLLITPNHICPVINLHDEVYGVRNGVVEQIIPVDARGKIR